MTHPELSTFDSIPYGKIAVAIYKGSVDCREYIFKQGFDGYIQLNNQHPVSYKHVVPYFGAANGIREATSDEIMWLEECMKAFELVPKQIWDIDTILKKLNL